MGVPILVLGGVHKARLFKRCVSVQAASCPDTQMDLGEPTLATSCPATQMDLGEPTLAGAFRPMIPLPFDTQMLAPKQMRQFSRLGVRWA